MAEGAEARMVKRVFPRATMITPNLLEAETLIGRRLRTTADVEKGAAELLALSRAGGVLIKGGHADGRGRDEGAGAEGRRSSSYHYAQDYWTDGTPEGSFWITSPRINSKNTHGTGCTLSSAAAACMAKGLDPTDAIVIAKAYVTQGIQEARRLGKGPGPVAQTGWPACAESFPWVTATAREGACERVGPFPQCHDDWGLYPVVDTAEW